MRGRERRLNDTTPGRKSIETLEPLAEAVIEGVESSGWELSGFQKTTSEEFRGRWAGESTRSAYLFFHRSDLGEGVSVDAFLDETTRGLRGNLALVLDGPLLGELPPPHEILTMAGRASSWCLPEGYITPITLRLALPEGEDEPWEAEAELRFKLTLPRTALAAGASAVSALASATADAFGTLLEEVVAKGFKPVD